MQTREAPASQHAFYQDGAWISLDTDYEPMYDEDYESSDAGPQDSYHNQLIKRFETLRSALEHGAQSMPQMAHDPGQYSPVKPPSNRHDWLYTIDREYPTTALVHQLDENNVRRGLEYCTHAMDRFDTISKQKSCWIWTLLALSGDIGTLDSQKMSHIRDLATKAAEMSNVLHTISGQQNRELTKHARREEMADKAQGGGGEFDQPVFCDTNTESHDPGSGFVQSDVHEEVKSQPGTPPNAAVPGIQDEAQLQAHMSTDMHEKTNTETSDSALEEARARLLAQLGDNLIQAGIPAPPLCSDEAHPHHIEQIDQESNAIQHTIKMRAIPSRAEAERQRQMMRKRESAPLLSRQSENRCDESHTAMLSSTDDAASCVADLNTMVTIDMILTVVAECYGQRDLLKFRKPW